MINKNLEIYILVVPCNIKNFRSSGHPERNEAWRSGAEGSLLAGREILRLRRVAAPLRMTA